MRLAFSVQALFWSTLVCDYAAAQRTYSFEEACRNAGWTTGPCAPKRSQVPECVSIVSNAFHAKAVSLAKDCIETTLSPVVDSEILVELIGIPNIAKLNELKITIRQTEGLDSAVAIFHREGRVIVLDPGWARSGSAEAYLTIGHEAGHHFCGHTLPSFQGNPHEKELEADSFSGAAIKRFETYHGKAFFREAIRAATRLYSEGGNRTHPPRAARIEAITLGYNSGSSCGGLAPAVRGHSPTPR